LCKKRSAALYIAFHVEHEEWIMQACS